MKTSVWTWGILAAAVLTACSPQTKENESANNTANHTNTTVSGSKRIAITAIVEHPALDDVRKGALEQLKTEGFEEGKNLTVDFQSAQGNTATATQIAKKFVGDKPDVVLAIGTPSAQAMAAASQDIPIVFAAVTDPVAAKLVPSWQASGSNVTGVSDQLPLEPQIDLIGYVYSPSEVNSTIVLNQLKTDLGKQNIELVAAPAQRTTDVLTAARSLNGKVQLIYTSLDNNIVSSFESMYKAGNEMKIPLLASNTETVPRGAVAALGVNYHNIGIESGKIIAKILKGEQAGTIAPQKMSQFDLHISPKHAQEQGVTLSDEIQKAATKVVE